MPSPLKVEDVIGWYDHPDQREPTWDPPLTCILCERPLIPPGPVKSVSIMAVPTDERPFPRSYFYRAHKKCYENTFAGIPNSERADDKAWKLIEMNIGDTHEHKA